MSKGETGSATPVQDDPLEAGRDAFVRHAWQEAFERLSAADEADGLSGADLESLATAAFFSAHPDHEMASKERAYEAYVREGNELRAAYLAIDIGRESGYLGKHAIAAAWTRRAEGLIGVEGDTYAHGYLALLRSGAATANGDPDTGMALAQRAVEIGEGAADADLRAFALSSLGELRIATGAPAVGIALMEEASISAVNGELSPFTTGVTACRMISACRDLTDYGRASEWIEATERYCDRQSLAAFPGVCQVHRAEVAAVGGAWDQAQLALERATTVLEAFRAVPPQADGFYAIGEIRRLKGDFEGAKVALGEAHARGRSPQPALALVRLAEGKAKAAASAINGAVSEESWNRWARARLLPAQAEIAIAIGDVAGARRAVDELSEIVAAYASPALEAGRRATLGRVLLAEGDAGGATREFRAAVKGWLEVQAPYEIARSRADLSRALREVGEDDDADIELQAALDAFRQLGARVDVESAERDARDVEDRRSGPVVARMTFMFTDIVGSTSLAEALGDLAWERLLRWHDDTLRGLVDRGAGEVVNSTGDGFFVAFSSARAGLACATSIQRALAEHGTTTGFALSVRIGLHTAEANRRGSDYSGKGVHVAARVSALAEAGEILATAATIAEAGDVRASETRTAKVKGVVAAVSYAAIDWSA